MSDASLADTIIRNIRISQRDIDSLLSAQLIVAWAGEKGDANDSTSRRLGWWDTNLVGEGAEYDLKELLPNTWRWAALQAVRQAAKIHDVTVRAKDHDPDRLLTLFSLGFEIDEKVDERLLQFKQNSRAIDEVLPDVGSMITPVWSVERFTSWVAKHGKESTTAVPAGRRLKGQPPEELQAMLGRLIAGLAPLTDSYPMPHFKQEGK
jgi:hypothetical protein